MIRLSTFETLFKLRTTSKASIYQKDHFAPSNSAASWLWEWVDINTSKYLENHNHHSRILPRRATLMTKKVSKPFLLLLEKLKIAFRCPSSSSTELGSTTSYHLDTAIEGKCIIE